MKRVTNKDMEQALNDKDIVSIMKWSTKPFARSIPYDDIKACQLCGLWKALQYFNGSTKFTTYLAKRIRYECLAFLKQEKKYNDALHSELFVDKYSRVNFNELIECLSDELKEVVKEYIIDNRTFNEIGKRHGYSHETARKRFNTALSIIKEAETA